MAKINISGEDLRNLKAIQHVITLEEGHETNLDEVLQRVLRFYRKNVCPIQLKRVRD